MGKEYKLRLPVMERKCSNCGLDYIQHVDGKCLFEPTNYAPGKIETKRKTVKAQVKKVDD